MRKTTKAVRIGRVTIGAGSPVAIQSMTKIKSSQVEAVVRQIRELEAVGCEIVRLAIKDEADALAIRKIKSRVKMPLVADIHFDWRLAMTAIEAGADKVRLNPGNIFRKAEIAQVVAAAKQARIPIRVGVNSGSVKGGKASVEAMVRSARDYIRILEGFKFKNIVISLKASNVCDTISTYRAMSKLSDYPLHLGVTATGSPFQGAIKSSIAIGALLSEGIGDTIRVSLTDKPEREVLAAKAILEAVGLRRFGPEIISCPTCGRCEVNLVKIVKELEIRLSTIDYRLLTRPLKIAVMGCVVNGPGEAKEADIGVAFGKKDGLVFKNGLALKKVSSAGCIEYLLKEIRGS
ncbi:MAG: flavodoxin-dependent (E)-4-hydroxy-3-methylbut-2-enyl-diphosphate synthase [Candidatus Omnitrophica bacterium]|nr:flavodoxin-dependent (E)-4-hydroxy-3-methylbut-2-enyl-diphosphate synthase [Candidatus Omnitrophota bacterium]